MARSIQEYKAVVGNLSLRHNFEFQVLNLPGANTNILTFFCQALTTPFSETTGLEVWWKGRRGEFPGAGMSDGDWELTLKIDKDWAVYDALYAARQLVFNHVTGRVGDWSEIVFNANVKMLDSEDSVIRRFQLIDCYLKRLGEIDKDHSAQGENDEVPITIHYDNWLYTP
jgi:hypothetical protein